MYKVHLNCNVSVCYYKSIYWSREKRNYIDEFELPAGRECLVKMILNNAYPRRELLIEMRLRYKLHILKYEYPNGFV